MLPRVSAQLDSGLAAISTTRGLPAVRPRCTGPDRSDPVGRCGGRPLAGRASLEGVPSPCRRSAPPSDEERSSLIADRPSCVSITDGWIDVPRLDIFLLGGLQVHFTETCDEDRPRLIVNVETTPATTPDDDMIEVVHESLESHDRLPGEHLVDKGYTDAH